MQLLIFYICQMKKKWYFGFLLTALATFVVLQQQAVVPNQQIVVQFVSTQISALDAEDAIREIQSQLQTVGVTNTRISKNLHNGQLTITYYSDADVANIKQLFVDHQQLIVDAVGLALSNKSTEQEPEEQDVLKAYHLDIYEVTPDTDLVVDYNATYHVEVDQRTDGAIQSLHTVPHLPCDTSLSLVAARLANLVAIHSTDFVHTTPSYTIPEVRAGPIV